MKFRSMLALSAAAVAMGIVFSPPISAVAAPEAPVTNDVLTVEFDHTMSGYPPQNVYTVRGHSGSPHQSIYLDRADVPNPDDGDWQGWVADNRYLTNATRTQVVNDVDDVWRVCVSDGDDKFRCSAWTPNPNGKWADALEVKFEKNTDGSDYYVRGTSAKDHQDIYLDHAPSGNPDAGTWTGWLGKKTNTHSTERVDRARGSWRVCVHDGESTPFRCSPWNTAPPVK